MLIEHCQRDVGQPRGREAALRRAGLGVLDLAELESQASGAAAGAQSGRYRSWVNALSWATQFWIVSAA